MRLADAPRAGWYPDPRDASRLRWWDGLDWTEERRIPPIRGSTEALAAVVEIGERGLVTSEADAIAAELSARSRRQTEEVISQVRDIARSEVDRAAEMFSQRAQAATRQIEPLISQYTNTFVRWVRILGMVAFLVLVVWFVFQFVIQASLFDWVGDRIDNLTDDN